MAASSGQSAQALAILAICEAGDNIVSTSYLYGGEWELWGDRMRWLTNLGSVISRRLLQPVQGLLQEVRHRGPLCYWR